MLNHLKLPPGVPLLLLARLRAQPLEFGLAPELLLVLAPPASPANVRGPFPVVLLFSHDPQHLPN